MQSCLPLWLQGDLLSLRQILTNLTHNALKFTKRGSVQILTAYDTTSETLHTSVIDSGKGITRIEMSEIFKMFGKLNRTASQNSEGLGMGLMICDTLVKMNEGAI